MSKRKSRHTNKREAKPTARLKKARQETDTQPEEPETDPVPGKRYFLKTISTATVLWFILAGTITLVSGWALVKPVVHVDPYIRLNSNSPFSEQFKVSNDGYFDIHDVECECIVKYFIQFPSGNSINNIRIQLRDPYRKLIEAANSTTVDCPLDDVIQFGGNTLHYDQAKIEFDVTFTPTFYLWHKQKQVQFTGKINSQGNVSWTY